MEVLRWFSSGLNGPAWDAVVCITCPQKPPLGAQWLRGEC